MMLTHMDNLQQLQRDTHSMTEEAKEYLEQTTMLKNYFWWKDCKLCMLMIMGVVFILGLVVFFVYRAAK